MRELAKWLGIVNTHDSCIIIFSNPLNILNLVARLILRVILGKRRSKTPAYAHFCRIHRLPLTFNRIPKQKQLMFSSGWKLLIILDACRYDYFKRECKIRGKLNAALSEGSCTIEWAKNTFIDKYDDVIYISGNPYISNHLFHGWRGTDHFHMVENVWDYGFRKVDGVHAIPPCEIYKATIKMLALHPEKRFIVHFLQPHTPYIGETKLRLDILKSIAYKRKWKSYEKMKPMQLQELELDEARFLKLIKEGAVNAKLIREMYKANLIFVLKYVKKLIKGLNEKIIITSDHGELLTYPLYGHHPNLNLPQLVMVPWFEVDLKYKGWSEVAEKPGIRARERLKERIRQLRKEGKF